MTVKELVGEVLGLPELAALQLTPTQQRDMIEPKVRGVGNSLALEYDWPFILEYDTETTVANQAEYRLEGARNDCRDIVYLEYLSPDGDSDTSVDWLVLTEKRVADFTRYMALHTLTTPSIWRVKQLSPNKAPLVEIAATPEEGGGTLRYCYRRNNIDVDEYPGSFRDALIYGTVVKMFPNYEPVYQMAVRQLKAQYNASGGEVVPVRIDPQTVSKNRRRAGLMGY